MIKYAKQFENSGISTIPDGRIPTGWIEITEEEYKQEQAQKERERLDNLSMTRSDFFDGTIKAFGADQTDLEQAITAVLATLPIEDLEKKVALNNYRNALNFYRKHPLLTMLSGVPIPLGEDKIITITSQQWDEFFDTGDWEKLITNLENGGQADD